MSFSQYTLSALTTEISNSLGDTGNVYWSTAEVGFAINEALHEWSGTTNYWRERGVFNTVPGQAYYDVSHTLQTLRTRAVTFDQLCREIQAHFSEPISGVTGIGMSTQFQIGTILASLVRAVNRFIIDAALPLVVQTVNLLTLPPDGRIQLPQNVVYLHRAAWVDFYGRNDSLPRSEGWAADSLQPDWTATHNIRPQTYSQAETRPIELQLIPAPNASGALEIMCVESQTLGTITSATTLGIPDDFAHAVKYAAMVDLLTTDSETTSDVLATYCQSRYNSILQAAQAHKAIIRVQINGVPLQIAPFASLDRMRPFWRNMTGKPDVAAVGYELIAFSKQPKTLSSISCDVCRSAPVLTQPTDFIQLGLEELEAVVKYAQHYLSFKLHGSEFKSTFPLFNDFQRQVGVRNTILSNQSRYLDASFGASAQEQTHRLDTRS